MKMNKNDWKCEVSCRFHVFPWRIQGLLSVFWSKGNGVSVVF